MRQQLDAAHVRIEKICAAKKSAELEYRREAEEKSADAVAEAVEEGKRALLAEKNLARAKLTQVRSVRAVNRLSCQWQQSFVCARTKKNQQIDLCVSIVFVVFRLKTHARVLIQH